MKKFILNSVFVLSLMLSLTACASNKEDPQINPDPKYFLTIHGYIDPALRSEIQLRFIQVYGGVSSSCSKVHNVLAGLPENPAKFIVYKVQFDQSGHYQVRIPLDYFTSGFCQWIPWSLNYTLTDQDFKLTQKGFALLNYDDQENMEYNPSVFDFVCDPDNMTTDDGIDNCTNSIPDNMSELIYVRTNESYTQEINVVTKGLSS